MKLLDRLVAPAPAPARNMTLEGLQQQIEQFSYLGLSYLVQQTMAGTKGDDERIAENFAGVVQSAYKRNGVVFATVLARMMLYTEARFVHQDMSRGRPGDLFGTDALEILERPWPNGRTGDLLTRVEQDVSLAGNFFGVDRRLRSGRRLRRLRPDWVSIVVGFEEDLGPDEIDDVDGDFLGIVYHPGGPTSGKDPIPFFRDEVVHFAPIPDPEASYRGMSWLSSVLTNVESHKAADTHKRKFFVNGATPNMVVSLKPEVQPDAFDAFVEKMDEQHRGLSKAYKTLFLGGGADVKVVGSDFQQLDFKRTQGHDETVIAAAGGVPAIIVGLSEGLDAATYSNFAQAKRKFGDHWARPQWRMTCAAFEHIVTAPPGPRSRLWYDARDIPFLRDDAKDEAEILKRNMAAIEAGIRSGFKAKSVVAAVSGNDLTKLDHTGLTSVQLLPPDVGGSDQDDDDQADDGDEADQDDQED